MPYASIDSVKYSFQGALTVYQFCFLNGINLPCFCYHEKLGIAGIVECVW
jgi:NADH dehydrogenase/NADH:ubiquinone oxidoreductase subunit G